MRLLATPRSHFSRKVRLLLDHLELPYELVDVGNVASDNSELFGNNPVMSVPVLQDADRTVFDSDHIADYVVRTYDEADQYAVMENDVDCMNARAVMNGIMANEVKLVLSARTGLDPEKHHYFQKARLSIEHGLGWLEGHTHLFVDAKTNYSHFHLVSMWDHLALYGLVDLDYPHLESVIKNYSGKELFKASAPPAL